MSVDDAAIWASLRRLTAARIGLRGAGCSVATRDHLAFAEAHALARDAVHGVLDTAALADAVAALGLAPLVLQTACPDTATFLTRPDLGRQLKAASRALLAAAPEGCDVAFVLAGGLSARGVAGHAILLLQAVLPALAGWRIGPVCIVERGRVALGDEIGVGLGARIVVVLIGERPGLSSPDSLGAYVTWNPHPGRTDAERNCVSNIRPAGLPPAQAAERLVWLLQRARSLAATGVALKDESDRPALSAE